MTATCTITDWVCLACGTLCDDLTLTLDPSGPIAQLEPDCGPARLWWERVAQTASGPVAAVNGQPTSFQTALDCAAERIRAARSPRLVGLDATSLEGQRAAVALAERIGAVIDSGSAEARARLAAMARVGRCSATFGEVHARADQILIWACDPTTTHPRFLTRFVDPPGRFAVAPRNVIVVGSTPNATSARASLCLSVRPEQRIAALATLLALLRCAPIRSEQVAATTGQTLDAWTTLADALRRARYGVVVTDSTLDDPVEYEALLRLVRALNQRPDGRFVHLSLGLPGNAAGAEAVLGWQAGYAPDVTFAAGYPAMGVPDLEHDLTIELGSAFNLNRAPAAAVATIRIAPDATVTPPEPAVAIASSALGISESGTVIRSDGLALPVLSVVPSSRPSVAAILRELLQRLPDAAEQGTSP
ncbi:MAG: tungsten-containing formylmethanofuran dehydrogenase subunit B [Isosphaeraceae bacterium]|jgi:formylmethanofuran dehydrogenase subunit B|nr:MAG: tungsten-containing formylmethanofuran dehydrogenase subunit B [Isosphaeraceae bacterium]